MVDHNRNSIESTSYDATLNAPNAAIDPLSVLRNSVATGVTGAPNRSGPMNDSSTAATAQSKGLAARAVGAVLGFLFMKDELALAEQKSLRPGQPGHTEFQVARAVLETARNIDDVPQRAWGAVVLLLQAAAFATRGIALRRGLLQDADDLALAWQKVVTEPDIAPTLDELPQGVRGRVDQLVLGGLKLEHSALNASELVALRSTLNRVAGQFVELLEREVTLRFRLQSERTLRWSTIAVVALAAVCWTQRSAIRSMMLPNLALHSDVRVSSNWRPGMYPPSGLVDGETTELGCHTDVEDHPWGLVDLGQVKTIHRVVVTNRVDGDTTRAVPLVVELSSDGKTFTPYAKQDSDFKVWAAKGRITKARYVRVTIQRQSMLHLNEIEVY